MNRKYDRIIELIKYISIQEDNFFTSKGDAHRNEIVFLLVSEYYGRMIRLKDYVGLSNYLNPFYFNATEAIGEQLTCNINKIIDEVCPSLASFKSTFEKDNCINALKWLVLAESGNTIAHKFYDLYEPLLLFFAIGGYMGMEHGSLIIGSNMVSMNSVITSIASKSPIDIYEITAGIWNKE